MINDYTRITETSKSILDLAFVSKSDKVYSSGVHHFGISDHSLIYLIRKNNKVKVPPKLIKSRCFKKFNEHNFVDTLKTLNWNDVLNTNDVDAALATFHDMFNQACNDHCPMKEKRITGSYPNWINSNYIKLSKDRNHYFAKAAKTNDPDDWKIGKHLRYKVNNLNKTLKKNYCNDAIKTNINDSKKLWSTIKQLIPKNNVSVSNVQTQSGITSNDMETANELNSFFTSIGKDLAAKFDNCKNGNTCSSNNSNCSINVGDTQGQDHFNFDVVTPDFVFDQICSISNNKSTGIGNDCIKLLKLAAPVICHPLAYICNLSIHTSVFPNEWKKAKVTPIFKDGDKTDVSNYRPISVLPILSKILERSVHDQLYNYLTCNNLLHPCQSGFRSKHSTNTALLDVTDHILNSMNNGMVTASIFLDLKKAFDTVDHDILIKKLKLYGVDGSTLKWFKSYLSKRIQSVCVNSTMSDFKNIDIGIPQGSILGPLLFIIYVNSLPNSVNCKCVMYADDTTLLISSSDPDTLQKELDLQLNNIINWFRLNKLTLNIKKTKLMLFGTKQNLTKFDDIKLNYDSEEIERVDKFKYLGVILDPTLSWDDHVQFLSNNVSKRIGVVCRVKYFLPPCTLNKLAKALVFPHFDQCSSVWSNFIAEHHNRLQILQNRLARVLLSADIRTPIDKLMKDLGWNRLNFSWVAAAPHSHL